jgi:hypothetical protein
VAGVRDSAAVRQLLAAPDSRLEYSDDELSVVRLSTTSR